MPDYVFTVNCPWCGAAVGVPFGRRAEDTSVITFRHDGCPAATQRRCADYAVISLPTDADGNLLPPV